MKRLFSAFAAAAVVFSTVCTAAPAHAENIYEGFVLSYTVSNKEVSITGCKGNDVMLQIPSELEGCPVTSIAENAFEGNKNISICMIPDSVKAIGAKAFSACPNLTTITLGSNVAKIGDYAFTACPSLLYIDVNKKNPTYSNINGCLYENGDTLLLYAGDKNAKIYEKTAAIRKGAFFGKADITSVTLPNSVKTIDDHAFSGCLSLKRITVPDSVTKLGKGCFMSCNSLQSVNLGKSVTEIPENCFHSCTSLSEVSFTDNVTSIGDDAFYSCAGISGIYIPSAVKTIGRDAIGKRYDTRSNASENISGFQIRGEKGSAAEKYASEQKISFLTGRDSRGDVNSDGKIDSVDASAVLAEYALLSSKGKGRFTEAQSKAADWNGDEKVDSVDASAILAEYARVQTL
ncbi:MAG: leucine-rich repeat protein [Ruminococcus sp.]|uniref:leucine-rich repeat protein n=1 Tax=Ruminococcus sp. TaxID=41978 RepID=UPI0025E6F11A|nr:leucine-rich repeat protein [Ruminococcus sp.]MCR4795526.1 leucine-rich repeat protein [Ruminococcus sp.]